MIPVAIFLFLCGAVLAWAYRVWILVPITLLVAIGTAVAEFITGSRIAAALGHMVLTSLMPQLGYAFGLFARSVLALRRTGTVVSRKDSVSELYALNSVSQDPQTRR